MAWRIYAASATGTSHVGKGIPCQDAFAFEADGERLVAVVCDGAGSASRSDQGSRVVADTVTRVLGERLRGDCAVLDDEDAFEASASAAIETARAALIELADADKASLSSYAATLVGFAGDARRGWFFHIGDGIGVAEAVASEDSADAPSVVSAPENGEYSNETYFVTGDAWRQHLRVLAVTAPTARLALMSDGAMPFAMDKGNTGLFKPFIEPVARYLASVGEDDGSRALLGTLDDPRTHGITSDDKTLLIALRG